VCAHALNIEICMRTQAYTISLPLKDVRLFKEFSHKLGWTVDAYPAEEVCPYNMDFVREVNASRKSKGKVIKLEDLWK